MFFWRGWGISVLLLLLFWLIVTVVLAKSFVPASAGSADASLQWVFVASLVLDGASVFLLDRYRRSHPRKVQDPATGQIVLVANADHLSYIPFGIWTYILYAIAAVLAVMTVLGYRIGD